MPWVIIDRPLVFVDQRLSEKSLFFCCCTAKQQSHILILKASQKILVAKCDPPGVRTSLFYIEFLCRRSNEDCAVALQGAAILLHCGLGSLDECFQPTFSVLIH